MTSSASTATWLSIAIARTTVPTPSTAVVAAGGSHSAPGALGLDEIVAEGQVVPGRHAEPAWSREMFDAARDEDPFEWLGFSA